MPTSTNRDLVITLLYGIYALAMSEKGLQELYDNHSFPFSLSLQISISKNFLGENTKIYIFIFEN